MAQFVQLVLVEGNVPFWVNPEHVSSVEDVPNVSPAASYVDIQNDAPSRVVVVGSALAVTTALSQPGPGPTPVSGGTYAPAASATSGPISLVGSSTFNVARVGSTVTITGRLTVSWVSSGTGTLALPVPPSLPFDPSPQVQGVVSHNPGAFFAGPWDQAPGLVGANGADVEVTIGTTTGGSQTFDVAIQYQTNAP